MWFGSHGTPGLAKLIDRRAPRREIHETRLALDERLADAAATLGDSASRTTVVTNSAIIVFREGLGGRAHPGGDHGVVRRRPPPAAPAGAGRRRARAAGVGRHLGARADAAALARPLRREARGGGGADRHRRAAADHELVLPPRLLERVDRQVPPPAQEARDRELRLRPGPRARRPRADERLPRGLRDRPLPAVARAQRGHRDGARGRRPRPGHDARRRGGDLRAAAQAALQADARRHRRADRLRARGHGRPDRADHAGHRLDPDHADRRRSAVLAGAVVRRLPDVGDDRRPGGRDGLRHRLLRAGPGGARAPAAPARRARAAA